MYRKRSAQSSRQSSERVSDTARSRLQLQTLPYKMEITGKGDWEMVTIGWTPFHSASLNNYKGTPAFIYDSALHRGNTDDGWRTKRQQPESPRTLLDGGLSSNRSARSWRQGSWRCGGSRPGVASWGLVGLLPAHRHRSDYLAEMCWLPDTTTAAGASSAPPCRFYRGSMQQKISRLASKRFRRGRDGAGYGIAARPPYRIGTKLMSSCYPRAAVEF